MAHFTESDIDDMYLMDIIDSDLYCELIDIQRTKIYKGHTKKKYDTSRQVRSSRVECSGNSQEMAEVNKTERLDNWKRRWDNQEIRFHKLEPNPALITFYDQLFGGEESSRTILIPLCGKSLDIAWLYERGHTVIGIELTELAITSFFNEHQLEFSKQAVVNGFLYQSKDERIKLYEGDLFGFDVDLIGQVDAVWDRGSLVAVFKDERQKYVALIRSFLKPKFRYLLQTIEYDEEEAALTPFQTPRCVTTAQVQQLYGHFCKVEILYSVDKTTEIPNIKAKTVMQTDILLTNKS